MNVPPEPEHAGLVQDHARFVRILDVRVAQSSHGGGTRGCQLRWWSARAAAPMPTAHRHDGAVTGDR